MGKLKANPTLTVIKPGPLSLIQDFGCFGVAHLDLHKVALLMTTLIVGRTTYLETQSIKQH